jgi:hypothetical protein
MCGAEVRIDLGGLYTEVNASRCGQDQSNPPKNVILGSCFSKFNVIDISELGDHALPLHDGTALRIKGQRLTED